MTCSYCTQPAISCSTVALGVAPEHERQHGTQADHRHVEIRRACLEHLRNLTRP